MPNELIITEKPKTGSKIAKALDENAKKEAINGVPYYNLDYKGKKVTVASSVGHVYNLAEKTPNKWQYPVFDIGWKESSKVRKGSDYTKKYVNAIKKLAKDADSFVVATDYDIEGEVIGLNIIRYACNQKDAARMKFSTLTKPDLIKAYENKSPSLDWGQALAGETRHTLDWYYGINISRALTHAIKSAGMFKILSTGRVQGPSLKIIVDKERSIQKFKPKTYWQIELVGNVSDALINAWHSEDKVFDKARAEEILEKTKNQEAVIKEVERKKFRQAPPTPFDLTTLQTEAYRCFKIAPKTTLVIAQNLYTDGYISYPRTSSQVLPKELGYKNLISELAKQDKYKKLASDLLSKQKLEPNNGKKTDPAHPAIYPTGVVPKNLDDRDSKIYDLIVKRFLATFSDHAVRETLKVDIEVNKEVFVAKGTTTIEKGWHTFYAPYADFKEEELPNVSKGQQVKVVEIKKHEKETQPPKRYTPASIIRELEKKSLGTKATRAGIIDTLYERGYVSGEQIQATELGIKTIESLEKFCPKIIDEDLTRKFEVEMEEIQEGKKKPEKVLGEARTLLEQILQELKQKEEQVGEKLKEAYRETARQANIVGKCPVCKEGNLRIITAKASGKRFIACDRYPECKTTFGIPQSGSIKPFKNPCKECGYPVVTVIRKGKRPWRLCINSNCPSRLKHSL